MLRLFLGVVLCAYVIQVTAVLELSRLGNTMYNCKKPVAMDAVGSNLYVACQDHSVNQWNGTWKMIITPSECGNPTGVRAIATVDGDVTVYASCSDRVVALYPNGTISRITQAHTKLGCYSATSLTVTSQHVYATCTHTSGEATHVMRIHRVTLDTLKLVTETQCLAPANIGVFTPFGSSTNHVFWTCRDDSAVNATIMKYDESLGNPLSIIGTAATCPTPTSLLPNLGNPIVTCGGSIGSKTLMLLGGGNPPQLFPSSQCVGARSLTHSFIGTNNGGVVAACSGTAGSGAGKAAIVTYDHDSQSNKIVVSDLTKCTTPAVVYGNSSSTDPLMRTYVGCIDNDNTIMKSAYIYLIQEQTTTPPPTTATPTTQTPTTNTPTTATPISGNNNNSTTATSTGGPHSNSTGSPTTATPTGGNNNSTGSPATTSPTTATPTNSSISTEAPTTATPTTVAPATTKPPNAAIMTSVSVISLLAAMTAAMLL